MTYPIDRRELVTRHDVRVGGFDPLGSLSVGNGEFAATVDVTGLQCFADECENGIPLGTQAQWGWHRIPNEEDYRLSETFNPYPVGDRTVDYPEVSARKGEGSSRRRAAVGYLRENPHRIDLGKLSLLLDGRELVPDEVARIDQRLRLWTGQIESRFALAGEPVVVTTLVHPAHDALAVRVVSPLLASGRLQLRLRFPAASTHFRNAWTWERRESHRTGASELDDGIGFKHELDEDTYHLRLSADALTLSRTGPHDFCLRSACDVQAMVLHFSPELPAQALTFESCHAAAEEHWATFWSNGMAIELASADPRAPELERRIVLSQYLTAIQCAGSMPPQETGLTTNSWHGKFHLEMHWWHAAHFALWGRADRLERSIAWYRRTLDVARATAARQGYAGARWPKMVGPDGQESPSDIGVFLIWQQPHLIHLLELLYRADPSPERLARDGQLVEETAAFMASFVQPDASGVRFDLPPPLMPAQESYRAELREVRNPTFELAYWRWGLETAQRWRERAGVERNGAWDNVLKGLARPAVRNGAYAIMSSPPFTRRDDHPAMLGALGLVPDTGFVDPAIMLETLRQVRRDWNWDSAWGWDFPLMAMTAARLEQPELAVDLLLMDAAKNRYLPNGHNFQHPLLPLYLPGNGGLLSAVALMARGWDGCGDRAAPGFPAKGWQVRVEGGFPAP